MKRSSWRSAPSASRNSIVQLPRRSAATVCAAVRPVAGAWIRGDAKVHGPSQTPIQIPAMLHRGVARRFYPRVEEEDAWRRRVRCRRALPVRGGECATQFRVDHRNRRSLRQVAEHCSWRAVRPAGGDRRRRRRRICSRSRCVSRCIHSRDQTSFRGITGARQAASQRDDQYQHDRTSHDDPGHVAAR